MRTAPRSLLLVAALGLAAAACGGDDTASSTTETETETEAEATTEAVATTQPAPTTTEGVDDVDSPYVVTVEDAGEEPRRQVRLAVEVDDTDRVTMRQETSVEIAAEGQVQTAPSPTNEFDLTYTVEAVDDGEFTAVGVYDDVRVLDTPGVDPAIIDEVRSMMGMFRDAEARTTFTTRGGVLEADLRGLDATGPAGAFLDQMAAGFMDSAESLSLPFPDEAIGPGARWRVDTETDIAGLPVEITTVVHLAELDEARAAGTMEQTMRFVPGDVRVMGAAATIISGELAGGGPIEWDLAGGLVPRSDLTISGTSEMEVDGVRVAQRQQQRVTYAAR